MVQDDQATRLRNRIVERLAGYGVEDPEVCADLIMDIEELQAAIMSFSTAAALMTRIADLHREGKARQKGGV